MAIRTGGRCRLVDVDNAVVSGIFGFAAGAFPNSTLWRPLPAAQQDKANNERNANNRWRGEGCEILQQDRLLSTDNARASRTLRSATAHVLNASAGNRLCRTHIRPVSRARLKFCLTRRAVFRLNPLVAAPPRGRPPTRWAHQASV